MLLSEFVDEIKSLDKRSKVFCIQVVRIPFSYPKVYLGIKDNVPISHKNYVPRWRLKRLDVP